jgi:hypothetical protein
VIIAQAVLLIFVPVKHKIRCMWLRCPIGQNVGFNSDMDFLGVENLKYGQ